MSQRMTRSRKRQIDEENFEKFGIVVDEFGCIADDFGTNSLKTVKKHDDEDPWDANYVVEVKRQKRDESPESNPVYFRKVLTTATVHRQDLAPLAQTEEEEEEEKIELELLENGETSDQKQEIEENDDTASDTTDKVAEDLKVLLEETKEDEIVPNGHVSPSHDMEKVISDTEIAKNTSKLEVVQKTPRMDFDKIDLLSSEVILECVDA